MSIESQIDSIIRRLQPRLAQYAVEWTQTNFKRQQWEGAPWPKRKRETRRSKGKQILVNTGKLYRSIKVVDGKNFGSLGIPYARVHNYGGSIEQAARSDNFVHPRNKRGPDKGRFKRGKLKPSGTGAGGRFSFRSRIIGMPQRKFIGSTPALKQYIVQGANIYLKNKIV